MKNFYSILIALGMGTTLVECAGAARVATPSPRSGAPAARLASQSFGSPAARAASLVITFGHNPVEALAAVSPATQSATNVQAATDKHAQQTPTPTPPSGTRTVVLNLNNTHILNLKINAHNHKRGAAVDLSLGAALSRTPATTARIAAAAGAAGIAPHQAGEFLKNFATLQVPTPSRSPSPITVVDVDVMASAPPTPTPAPANLTNLCCSSCCNNVDFRCCSSSGRSTSPITTYRVNN